MSKAIRIRSAISAALGVFVVLVAIAGTAAVGEFDANLDHIQRLGKDNIERAGDLADVARLALQANAQWIEAKTYMEGGLVEDRDRVAVIADRFLAQADRVSARLAANPDDDESGKPLFDRVLASYRALAGTGLGPLGKALKGWNGIEANRLSADVVPKLTDGFIADLQNYQSYLRRQGIGAIDQAAFAADRAKLIAIVLVAFLLLLALLARVAFGRGVFRPLAQAQACFERMADGDLAAPIAHAGQNEIGVLFGAMRRMQSGLSDAVSVMRTGTHAMEDHVGAIAQAAADTSERTALQAAQLGQAGTHMDSAACAVAQTRSDAAQASLAVEAASGKASSAGVSIEATVGAMRELASRSSRIGEIVKVVDSIAFQTNMLALNAAVEAARAGQQGRGFAVVAAEVRGLAQNSGQAAREIKALVEGIQALLATGSVKAETSGAIMRETVQSIAAAAECMTSIAAAAEQQSLSIGDAHQAVAQAEQGARDNAALAEETAEAAHALADRASELQAAVARFRLAPHQVDVAFDHQRQVPMLDLVLDLGGRRGHVLRTDAAA
jgi:methyl-accepting chemotaxis protein